VRSRGPGTSSTLKRVVSANGSGILYPSFVPSRECNLSSTERLWKTEKKTVILEALGDGKFSLSAQGIDKPITIMADEVFEVRTNGKQLVLLRKSRTYNPSDHDAIVTVLQAPAECSARRKASGLKGGNIGIEPDRIAPKLRFQPRCNREISTSR
jgi:hypothetical protein